MSFGNKLPQTFCKTLIRISFGFSSLWPDSNNNWVTEYPYLLCSKSWSCHFLLPFSSAWWIGLFCFSIWKQCHPFDHPCFCSVFHCTFADACLPNIFRFIFLKILKIFSSISAPLVWQFPSMKRKWSPALTWLMWPISSQCFLLSLNKLQIKCTVFLPFKGPSSLPSKRLSQWSDFRPLIWQQRALSTRHQAGLVKEDLYILFCEDFLLCDVGVQLQQAGGFCALRRMKAAGVRFLLFHILLSWNSWTQLINYFIGNVYCISVLL